MIDWTNLTRSLRTWEYGPLAVVIALAAALRFGFLNQQSFWFDEAVTVELVHKSLPKMLAALPNSESTPPLYYVLAWGWSRIFGTGEVGLRALSALLGTATVPLSFAIGRLFVSKRAGLFAAGLVACSPFLVWYSQEARSYALLAFLSALSVLVFGHALRRPTPRAFTSWAVVACLALLTHYFAVFLIGAEALWLLSARSRCRAAWLAVGGAAAAGSALLPLALHQENSGQTWWIGAQPLSGRVRETLRQFVTGEYAPPAHIAIVIALVAVALATAGLVGFTEGWERRGAATVFALGGIAVLAPLALASTRFDKFFYRNLIGAWVLLAIGLAIVFASRRARRLGLVLVTAAAAVELGSLTLVLLRPTLQRDDWRSATRALDLRAGPLAIVTAPSYESVAIELYRPDVGRMPPAGARVREIVFLGFGRLPLDFRPPVGFERVDQRRIQHVALVRYRASSPHIVTPAEVASRSRFSADGVLLESGPPG
ncbi:MAG: glycosyltransferase family 39 protein [Actinomycetota bacterium]|nr:glycosyltransferase family 39 protein [Actinomycetota bacterium]